MKKDKKFIALVDEETKECIVFEQYFFGLRYKYYNTSFQKREVIDKVKDVMGKRVVDIICLKVIAKTLQLDLVRMNNRELFEVLL